MNGLFDSETIDTIPRKTTKKLYYIIIDHYLAILKKRYVDYPHICFDASQKHTTINTIPPYTHLHKCFIVVLGQIYSFCPLGTCWHCITQNKAQFNLESNTAKFTQHAIDRSYQCSKQSQFCELPSGQPF